MRRLRATHPESPRPRILVPVSLVVLLFLLPGCAPVQPRPVTTPEANMAPSTASEPAAPSPMAADEALLSARAHQAAGEQALLNGDTALARQEFDAAIRVLEQGGRDPRLAEVTSEIAEQIRALDAPADPAESEPAVEVLAEEEVEPSPHDELVTTPELTPGEIEKERSLIEYAGLKFDIPFVVNDRVISWVDYFTNRQRDKFLPGLIRSGRYLPMIHRIFEEEGLPLDLAYMAHVESAYKPHAYSRAKAKGIFQFIAGTGKRYGLRIDSWVDERSDPEKATRAAAAYLKDLYAMFGDWYLALAAYNAGEGKIQRVINRTGQRDFWVLASKRVLRNETNNYVPAILAAALVSKDPGRFGFDFEYAPPMEYETIRVEGSVHLAVLARCSGTDLATMQDLNPALRRRQTPAGTTDVRVPLGTSEATLSALADVPEADRGLAARHVVAKGETIGGIANRYGVTTAAIRRANGMGSKAGVREGQSLAIPGGAAEVASGGGHAARPAGATVYRVRSGDTLSAIARSHGTTPARIASASGIGVNSILRVGQRLTIPGRGGTVAQAKPAKPKQATTSGERVVHTVRRGETLYGIAARYQVTVNRICALNDIAPNATIYPGLRLTIQ